MEKRECEEYVESRYSVQVQWYEDKSRSNQRWYTRLQWGLIILSALTPVLIAVDFRVSGYPFLKWIPVITAVIVTVLASAQKTFKFQENWINYRTTCETLKKEIHLYRASVGEYLEAKDKEALFVERIENLISREHTYWFTTASKKEGE